MKINKVALIGLGAMGSFFAPKLWNCLGNDGFTVIAGGDRKERLENKGVTINGHNYRFKISSPEGGREPVDLIIMAGKEMQLEEAIANAKGIDLGEKEIEGQEATLRTIPFPNKPSTLQDIENSRKTEIGLFAGKVMEYGDELGIDTPICFMYYHGIRVLEEKNENRFKVKI